MAPSATLNESAHLLSHSSGRSINANDSHDTAASSRSPLQALLSKIIPSKSDSPKKNISVNLTFFKRFSRLILIQYGLMRRASRDKSSKTVSLSSASIIVCVLATLLVMIASFLQAVGQVLISTVVGDWTEHVLEAKYDIAAYDIVKLLLIWASSSICFAAGDACKSVLYYFWRKAITLFVLEKYLRGKNYYDILQKNDGVEPQDEDDDEGMAAGLIDGAGDLMDALDEDGEPVEGAQSLRSRTSRVANRLSSRRASKRLSRRKNRAPAQSSEVWIDNPDQRIQSDIDSYCTTASEIFVTGSRQMAGVLVSSFVIILNKMHFSVFAVVLGWPILNLLIFRVIMPTITKSVYRMDEHEGYFRYAHARVREYAESMTFFRADRKERHYIESSFRKLLRVIRILAVKYFPLQTYTMAMQRVPQISIFIWLFGAIQLHWGPFTPDLSTEALQNVGAKWYMYIQSTTDAWFGIFLLGTLFTQLTGNTHRIMEMLEVCDRVERQSEQNAGDVGEDPDKVQVQNLNIVTPTNKVLIKNVSFTVEPGDSLCIFGESGCGKTTLLRQLAGLVPCPQGSIRRPTTFGRGGALFLPQIPYLIRGTLIHQIIYPYSLTEMPATPEQIQKCMEKANVAYIADRYGYERKLNWDKILSEGEKQRLQIARVLFHQPKFAFMDESSASLDSDNQHICYSSLRDAGITLISVAHVEAVKQYHSQILQLHKSGTWTLSRIEPSNAYEQSLHDWEEIANGDSIPSTEASFVSTEDVDIDEKVASQSTGNTGLNWALVVRYFKVLKIILRPRNLCSDIVLPVVSIFVYILNAVATFPIIIVYGQMVAAIFSKSWSLIATMSAILFGIILSYSTVYGLSTSIAMLKGVEWRRKLTEHCHSLYFRNKTYFKMISLDKVIQNADQRIASDVNSLTSGFTDSNGLPSIEFLSISLIAFAVITAVAVVLLTHVAAFVMLFVVVVVYSFLHIVLMIKISKVQFQVDTKEGWFRYQMVRLKEHAEQIALYDGKRREEAVILHFFESMMQTQAKLLFFSSWLTSYTSSLTSCAFIINYIICTVMLYFGLTTLGDGSIEQKTGVIQTMQGLIGLLVMNVTSTMALGPKLAKNMGFVGRAAHFMERCTSLTNEYESVKDFENSEDCVSLENVTVKTPKGEALMRDLSFSVPRGSNLLIQGASGCGKSSILRLIGGLWPLTEGDIKRPVNIGRDGIFFAPQKCYFCLGTLKDNIIYPDVESSNSDQELEYLLSKVNLSYLYERIGGLDIVHEWSCVLSPGEQQRLAAARVLYHRPAFLLADEITSSCDLENEKLIYDLLREYGISCISVGHRDSIVQHHDMLMKIGNEGAWSFSRRSSRVNKSFKGDEKSQMQEVTFE
mmetsp:Transcript_7472/g.28009  ORF Transcript_7472/g.28009 Transcript_7472/m.28009 type:complete len:1367 (-) Transcript_7472:1856-5956(-)|eukprot:CAMPEP_0117439934 /NCGR_PEP_ID=MMETSP0759-20121206/2817_1 /TAXON_ID=63605 /ORGANISM="Percolomonas cosmopolitus, Strain WS" /LENGTH=1366 /DNA_ID=CAMNT_0005231657 /DNA_START=100 /DNA_END=4200 /DNA_ORIENTATION=-